MRGQRKARSCSWARRSSNACPQRGPRQTIHSAPTWCRTDCTYRRRDEAREQRQCGARGSIGVLCAIHAPHRGRARSGGSALRRFHMRSQRSVLRLHVHARQSSRAPRRPSKQVKLQAAPRARTTTAAAWAAACRRPPPARRAAAGSPQPCALRSARRRTTAQTEPAQRKGRWPTAEALTGELSTGLPHAGQQLGVRAPREAAQGSAEAGRRAKDDVVCGAFA